MKFPTHIVAAGVLVENNKNEILLVKNPRRGWEFPGGQIENGEDLIEGASREVREESGIEVEIDMLTGVYSVINSYIGWDNETIVPTKVIFDFHGKVIGGNLKTSEESMEVGWFSKDEAMKLITNKVCKDRMNDMLSFDGKVIYRVYENYPYKSLKKRFL